MALYSPIQALVKKAQENFPVASFLLPKAARSPILHFYSFARHADDIADSATMPAHEKTAYLSHLQLCVRERDARSAPLWAQSYIQDLQAGKSDKIHGENLLHAFLQDAVKNRYLSFEELIDYCRYSAAPVGRVVLQSCNETTADLAAADALCTVLQLINHLQDCQKDYREINRVYLPKDWMQKYDVSEVDLDADITSPQLRCLFDRYLQECSTLLAQANHLPKTVSGWRLRLELALILELALQLVKRLAQHDPLQKHVKLAHWQWPIYFLRSLRHL